MMAWARRGGRLTTGRRGAATVELALIIPMFLLMTFAILEFGHTWYVWHAIHNASREGARYAIVYRNIPDTNNRQAPKNLTKPTIKEFVDNYLLNSFSQIFWEVPEQPDWSNTISGSPVTVIVRANKNWFILHFLIPGITAFTIEAKTVMEIE
jgi:hypothetical protein